MTEPTIHQLFDLSGKTAPDYRRVGPSGPLADERARGGRVLQLLSPAAILNGLGTLPANCQTPAGPATTR